MNAKESVYYERGSLSASWYMSRIIVSHCICQQMCLERSSVSRPNHGVGVKVQLSLFKYEKHADDLSREFRHTRS